MAKIESYRLGFNPTTRLGLVEFRTVESTHIIPIGNLPASEFNAISAILSSGEAYAEGRWIHTGVESLSSKSAAEAFIPPPGDE